ncbi:hypothetical protein FOA52_000801 [Chlamydomonas sp. UWO 241]|nr:hypothetical protein FOA52_000801 [Chlamydomonas sp. UWO 241]
MFGGSLELGYRVSWLDLDTATWGALTVLGTPPSKRMSAVMALSSTQLLIYGGWIYSEGEMGDLYSCSLVLDNDGDELKKCKAAAVAADIAQAEAAAAAAAAAAAGGGSTGAGGIGGDVDGVPVRGPVDTRAGSLPDQVNRLMATYYRLMSEAKELNTEDGLVPAELVRDMNRVMVRIGLLQAAMQQEGSDSDGDSDDGDDDGDGSDVEYEYEGGEEDGSSEYEDAHAGDGEGDTEEGEEGEEEGPVGQGDVGAGEEDGDEFADAHEGESPRASPATAP